MHLIIKWEMQKIGTADKQSLSMSKKSEGYVVIANQSADWCGNPPVRRKNYWFGIENQEDCDWRNPWKGLRQRALY